MADRDDEPGDKNPEDEFRDMLRELLSGSGGIDPSKLAGAAGLPNDPASLAALIGQLQQAMNRSGDGIDWSVALRQGEERAASGQRQLTAEERARLDQALHVASLWLDEVVDFSALPDDPRTAHPARVGRGDDAGLDAARRAGRAQHRRRAHARA